MRFSRFILPLIIISLMLFSFLLIQFGNYSNKRDLKEETYKGLTLAKITSVQIESKSYFSETGTDSFISHRIVNYSFFVDGVKYYGCDVVPGKYRFRKINLKISANQDIFVKYDLNDPTQNIISRNCKGLY